MIDLVNIFQNFAFPVASCIVLFWFAVLIIKRELRQNEATQKEVTAANERFTNYLQNQNIQFSNIVAENTRVYKTLIKILEDVNNFLEEKKHDRK